MLLNNSSNSYLRLTKGSDFQIQWLGPTDDGRKWIVDMYFRWVSWGWKLFTKDIAYGVQEALGIVVFDREIDLWIIENVRGILQRWSIIWDVANHWEEGWLIIETTENWVLRVWLHQETKGKLVSRKSIHLDVWIHWTHVTDSNSPALVLATQRQFAQLANLALAIQAYNTLWWK